MLSRRPFSQVCFSALLFAGTGRLRAADPVHPERKLATLPGADLRAAVDRARDTFRVVDGRTVRQLARVVPGPEGAQLVSDWENPAQGSAGDLVRLKARIVAHEFGDLFRTDQNSVVEFVGIPGIRIGAEIKGWGRADATPYPSGNQKLPRYRWVPVRAATSLEIEARLRAGDSFLLAVPSELSCAACAGAGRVERPGQLKRHCAVCKGSGKEPRLVLRRITA